MKVNNINILQKFILFFCSSMLIFSCTTESEVIENNTTSFDLNTIVLDLDKVFNTTRNTVNNNKLNLLGGTDKEIQNYIIDNIDNIALNAIENLIKNNDDSSLSVNNLTTSTEFNDIGLDLSNLILDDILTDELIDAFNNFDPTTVIPENYGLPGDAANYLDGLALTLDNQNFDQTIELLNDYNTNYSTINPNGLDGAFPELQISDSNINGAEITYAIIEMVEENLDIINQTLSSAGCEGSSSALAGAAVGGAITGARVGYLIGSFLGPAGTAAGAVGGAIFGAIFSSIINIGTQALASDCV